MFSPRRSASSSAGSLALRLAVLHVAVQLEPVDAGGHFHAVRARPPEDLALGFDVPAGFHQRPRHLRQLGGRQVPAGFRVSKAA